MSQRDKTPLELGKRERQIYETVVRLQEASVAQVRQELADPPSYSAVRATLGFLVDKDWLKFRRDGQKYLYRPAASPKKTRSSAIQRLLATVFGGSARDAMVALLDETAEDLTDDQLREISKLIQQARKEKK